MSKHSKPSRTTHSNVANRVRIIGGAWRSRVIEFPDSAGLRPTPNRVRETLFNWLGQTLHGLHCLDLFAGSGALGFEAGSRGATRVVMVENSRPVFQSLQVSKERLGASSCDLVVADADTFLHRNRECYDVVFLDPPFALDILPNLLNNVRPHVAPGGKIYVECGEQLSSVVEKSGAGQWVLDRQGKAGVVHFGLISIAQGAP